MSIDLEQLQRLLAPESDPDPIGQLDELAKTFVAKRPTREPSALQWIELEGLQVDPDYQRPPDRDKIAQFVEHLKAGGKLPAIKVNERPDGTRWITDGQHRAAAAALCGATRLKGRVTRKPRQDEPQETEIVAKTRPAEIVAKVAADRDEQTIERLLGAGAERVGKRLTLDLGRAGRIAYFPHAEALVGQGERGTIIVNAPNVEKVLDRLGIRPETAAVIDGATLVAP